ncbi:diacylglycerol/lipid kinase family protein [Pseudonocardia broussonetiae]|uniref:Diacylglycerol kinase n=1 Tax=Pseudonocardia broussonetiae TaxID=2736640 RepID=A0A6M6JNF2_9PSEU|nr:diacylglycerol kinase family protein [Pseudonocardia broussonetiae]QJY47969.1 diacylglycerol kinase [Pseudonocardia broussonetiae]
MDGSEGTPAAAGRATPSVRPAPTAGRRVAAAGALVALLLAITLAVVGFLDDPVRLLVAVVLVTVVAMAGWTALVNRGTPRVIAAVAAGAALLGLVVLLLTGTPLRAAGLIGLVLVSTAAARVALGHDMATAPAGMREVGPAAHGVLIMNRWSGGGKVERFGLEAAARAQGVTPIVLQRGDDLRELAERAIADGADVIGMAGGDGSQALVADVAHRRGIPFVCVPAGTRNHFALDLGLDRADVAAALAAYGHAVERRVDLALIGDRVFVNNASLGVYATVVQSAAYRDAKMATTAQVLPDLLGSGAAGFDLRYAGPDGQLAHPAHVVLVSNNVYRLDSLNGFGTRARTDAGVLGVVTVTVDRARDLPALIAAETSGHIERFRGYRAWTTPEFVIDSDDLLVDVGVDGEALQLAPPLHFRSLPGALRVRTPVDAPGVAPAAAAPRGIGPAVTALVRVLAGRSPADGPAVPVPPAER